MLVLWPIWLTKANFKRNLIKCIRKRQSTLRRLILRRNELENIIKTGKINGKKKQRTAKKKSLIV